MITEMLAAGAGSFLGGSARYLISVLLKNASQGFPLATLLVNLAGSFIIGLAWGWAARPGGMSPVLNVFLTAGICGGFTTFSTFSRENLLLLQQGNWSLAVLYTLISLLGGLAAVAGGYALAR